MTGTSGNDTFIAGDDGGTASLNAGDVISGGAGVDTVKVINGAAADNGAAFTLADISGVEKVLFTAAATTEAIDVSGNADVTEVWAVKGVDSVVTLTLAQKAGISGKVTTTAAQNFAFASVAGAADSATLMLEDADTTAGGAGDGVDIQNVETLNITLTGTNKLGELDSDATKLVITGAGSLATELTEAGGTASKVKTIDASAATGALDINNKTFAGALETITLGSGDDRYVSQFAKKDALDKIDLGAGTNDILAFSDATDLSTAAKALVIGGAKNYEAIEHTGTGAFKVDGDALTGIKSFIADTTGVLTATNIYSGTKITVGDVALSASTAAMKLGQKVLDVALAGSKTAISDASAGITVTGATDINVTSSGFADQAENNLNVTSDDNTTIKISGAKDLILATTAATATTGFTIDGSDATGKLNITGTAAADIIKGGSAVDTFNISAGVDTFTGNGGADKFVVLVADNDITVGTIAATAIITDFVTGSDTLGGMGVAGTAANYVEATSVAASLAALLTAADTALGAGAKYYVGQVGSDVYVASDNDATDFTSLIKLTGVALDGIAYTDIVA